MQTRNSVGIGVTYGKLSDTMINAIRSKTGTQDMVYRIERQASTFNSDGGDWSYWSGNCSFSQKTGPQLAVSYPSFTLNSPTYANKLLRQTYAIWCNQSNILVAYFCDGNSNARMVYVTSYTQHIGWA